MVVQCLPIDAERRNHGNIAFGQFHGEGVFFQDRVVTPTTGTIELGDDGIGIVDANAEHAVLVAVERQHAAIAVEAHGLQRIQHAIRIQSGEGCFVVGHASGDGIQRRNVPRQIAVDVALRPDGAPAVLGKHLAIPAGGP